MGPTAISPPGLVSVTCVAATADPTPVAVSRTAAAAATFRRSNRLRPRRAAKVPRRPFGGCTEPFGGLAAISSPWKGGGCQPIFVSSVGKTFDDVGKSGTYAVAAFKEARVVKETSNHTGRPRRRG